MNRERKIAIIAGALILIAYGAVVSGLTDSKAVIIIIEAVSGLAVVFIALLMYRVFNPHNHTIALWFAVIRMAEGIVLTLAAFLYLPDNKILLEVHQWLYMVHPFVFILSGLLFYYLFYRSKLIPRFISVWGGIALIMLLVVNILELTGCSSAAAQILYLPLVLNEFFLAIWLIARGFSVSKASG